MKAETIYEVPEPQCSYDLHAAPSSKPKRGRFRDHLRRINREHPRIRDSTRTALGIAVVVLVFAFTYMACNYWHGASIVSAFVACMAWIFYQMFFPDRDADIATLEFGIPPFVLHTIREQLPSPYYAKLVDNLYVELETLCEDHSKSDEEIKRMSADKVVDLLNGELAVRRDGRYHVRIEYIFE